MTTNNVLKINESADSITIFGKIENNYGYVVIDRAAWSAYFNGSAALTIENAEQYTNDEANETEDGYSVYGFDSLEEAEADAIA